MKILGIETSCDETAVSIIDAGGDFVVNDKNDFKFEVLGNALFSQAEKHAEYGGVYPNLAKREHSKNLVPILNSALKKADMLENADSPEVPKEKLDAIKSILDREPELFAKLMLFFAQYKKPNIDAVAVTVGPGLEPALWVGVNFARALSLAWNTKVVPVNHMEGHIIISSMDFNKLTLASLAFPTLSLLISGGHTEMVLSKSWLKYEKIGQTIDDAIGEAFDKVARLLGLSYPGGPEISRLAKQAREQGYPLLKKLPRPMIHKDNNDFSFSGLKTAVLRLVQQKLDVGTSDVPTLSDLEKMQIAREFENAVADVLCAKVRKAIEETGAQTLILGGGVSANSYIKNELSKMITKEFPKINLLVSDPKDATDNALMISLAGYFHAVRGEYEQHENLHAQANLTL